MLPRVPVRPSPRGQTLPNCWAGSDPAGRAGTRRARIAQRGIALVEVAFVTLVVAVLAAVSVPSFTNFVVTQRLRAAGSDLVSSLEIARREAIRRNGTITVKPSAESWTGGWVVATALGDALDRRSALDRRVIVASAPASVVYGPDGQVTLPGATRFQLADAQNTAGVTPRCVIVDASGHPHVEAKPCE